ncbi:MAG: hypothetical protein M0C28_34415 [Candidatus Moduliflexus flocculans]|nr:hypothetical protein [Candidatus Moduliflexus flocculans]
MAVVVAALAGGVLHRLVFPRRAACLPLRRLRHHRHDPRCRHRLQRGRHRQPAASAGRSTSLFLTALLTVIGFSVQDKIVVFDRIRENSNILPPPGFRNAGQPLHRPDPAALDQHPADDRGIPPAGAGPVRRRHPAGICRHPAGRPVERNLFIHLHRRPHPRVVGKPANGRTGSASLPPHKPGR